jgi:hypothetical protein
VAGGERVVDESACYGPIGFWGQAKERGGCGKEAAAA